MLQEFVFERAPFAACHASTVLETTGGDLLVAWFGGRVEGADDVAIWMARRTAAGWSKPVAMARHRGTATWNPVLFRAADGTTWLYYKFGVCARDWTAARRRSDDDGRTWSEIERLPAGIFGPVKNKPHILEDGTIVAGSSVESYQSWASYAELSADHGRTWIRSTPIVHPNEPCGVIQPAIFPHPGGLRMVLRSRGIGRVCEASSEDGGLTWTPARETRLVNPNSAVDAVALADGRIVLVYNPVRHGRSPLALAVSHNGGLAWRRFLNLETRRGLVFWLIPERRDEYSYPAVIQGSSGDLHITYTWKRRRIRYARVPLSLVP